MKMMSLALFAMPGLLAASFACTAPAMADETTSSAPAMQQAPAVNNSVQDQGAAMQNNGDAMQNNGAAMQNNPAAATPDNSASGNVTIPPASTDQGAAGNAGSSDQGTPDTATGDDDY